MSYMPVTDAMFLIAESREHPMHVGGLQLFQPPDGAGPSYVRDVYDQLTADEAVDSVFRKRPARPVNSVGNLWWTHDENLDFDYHVRHSAVPGPGRVRELLQLVSRWHGGLLDRHRPLWEMHLVEGLKDGRFAIYTKTHHALLDGVSALRVLQRSMSRDPDARDCTAFWAPQERAPRAAGGFDPMSMLRGGADVVGQLAGVTPTIARMVNQAMRDHDVPLPFTAPKTMLNNNIGGARRFAAQSWSIERVRAVAKAAEATVNDVVLAMCAGALRSYLIEQHALPDEPLTAMVPVSLSLRAETGAETGAETTADGNAVGAVVVSLATDEAEAPLRLEAIKNSVLQAKRMMTDLTPLQILVLSGLSIGPLALTPVPGFVNYTRPPFNVIISNVPGPTEQMYWNGARLDGLYPASIVLDGQALNITLTSNNGSLDFGVVGCRKSVPHLQRILTHLETALGELEKALT